jgi:hypothetical protein
MPPGAESRVVAIHQPNFFPWLGYFDKIANCDEFVLLDDAQFQKKGGVWTNRVRLLINGEPRWLTAPIDRSYHGYRAVNEIEFDDAQPWRETMVRTIEVNYRRAPFYRAASELLLPLLCNPERFIATYNRTAIEALVQAMRLSRASIRCASALGVAGASTARLINLTTQLGGTTYMCGGGAEGYQQDQEFAGGGIQLRYQNFTHPVYEQRGAQSFVPGLSIIDALMNVGVEGTRQLLTGDGHG